MIVPVAETDRDIVPVTDTVEVPLPVLLTDRVRVGVTVADQVKEAFADVEGEPDTDRVTVPVGETD